MFILFLFSCYFTAILSLIMGCFVFFKNRKAKANWLWSGVSLMTAVWSFSLAKIITAPTMHSAIVWNWVLYWAAVFIPVLFFHFVTVLIGQEKKYARYFNAAYTLVLILLFFIPTKYFVAGVSPKAGFAYWLDSGPLLYVYVLMFLAFVIWSFVLLNRNIGKAFGYKKYQLTYVFYCGLFGFGGAITDFFPQLFNIYPFAHFFVLFYVVFIAYAITRYRLLDIKSIIRKSSIFTFLVVIISAALVVFPNLLVYLLDGQLGKNSQSVAAILSAIVVVIFYEPLKRLIAGFTDRFLFIKSYDPSQVLSEINTWAVSEIDLPRLLNLLEEKLEDIYSFNKIAFLFLNEKKQLNLTKQVGFDQKQLSQFALGKEKVLPLYFSDNREIKVIPELKAAYDGGDYRPKNLEVLIGLYDMDVALVVPLFVKENLIGVVLIGSKKSNDSYSQEDINTISAIAGQLAMAIENARLYEKQKQFNSKLKIEIKKATEKLVSANKELQRLDDAKSEFLSIASHQLRTPTTIIRGYISMMQEGSFGVVSPIIKENLDKVNLAAERLLNLIENLLDISRIEAGRLEFDMTPVDLRQTANDLLEDFKSKAEAKKLKLSVYAPDDLPLVNADIQKIKEVASNLVDNAIKYTKKGEVSMDLHQEGSSAVFSVVDTGMGIANDDLPRLFSKFVRGQGMTQVHPEGTGLGLYFARVVVENMGGRIWVESAGKGKGSKFSFSLPLANKKLAKKVS